MPYSYNAPVYTAPAQVQRPPCWGKAFEDGNRECRGCGFQNSCKDEIIRLNMARGIPAQQAPPPYAVPQAMPVAQPPGYPQPAYQPQPQYPQPQYQPQYQAGYQPVARTLAPPPPQYQPQPQQVARQLAPPPQPQAPFGYGWWQDPMQYTVATAPPLVRPQMQGESFMERVVKNTGLAMLESFFGQCFLAVRQMVLAPPPMEVQSAPPPQPPPQQPLPAPGSVPNQLPPR